MAQSVTAAARRGCRGALVAGAVALAAAIGAPAFAAPGADPGSVEKAANPGTSFTIDKTVHTPEIPPKPDIVLLVDTTGSMGPAIANVRTNLHTIVSDVRSAQPTARFAVASYRDVTDGGELFQLRQPLTDVESQVQAAVNGLDAAGGGDAPEAWINGLVEVSTQVTYRPGSSRIVVLVGDAPSHDPSNSHTLDEAVGALKADNAKVVAVNVETGGLGLNGFGQVDKLLAQTGGEAVSGGASEVTKAILAGLRNLDVTVSPQVVACDSALAVSFDKTEVTVSSGSDAKFVETVTVAGGAPQGGTLQCTVRFLINGAPAGDPFTQQITVRVNDVTAPTAACGPGPNPGGNVPPPSEAGFFTLTAKDALDPNPAIYIKDTGSTAKFGPYKSGTTIKLTQAPGATPEAKPGTGEVDWKVRLKGDALIVAVDAAGNQSPAAKCLVPPPPK